MRSPLGAVCALGGSASAPTGPVALLGSGCPAGSPAAGSTVTGPCAVGDVRDRRPSETGIELLRRAVGRSRQAVGSPAGRSMVWCRHISFAARATAAAVTALQMARPATAWVRGKNWIPFFQIRWLISCRASTRIAPKVSTTNGMAVHPASMHASIFFLILARAAWSRRLEVGSVPNVEAGADARTEVTTVKSTATGRLPQEGRRMSAGRMSVRPGGDCSNTTVTPA